MHCVIEYNYSQENNCASERRLNKMTIKELRTRSGMTQKAFAEYFGVSKRAVENWEGGQRQCPEYLLDLMQYKLEKEGKIEQKKDELDEILAKAHKEATLSEMKQKLKAHEEWKKKHLKHSLQTSMKNSLA